MLSSVMAVHWQVVLLFLYFTLTVSGFHSRATGNGEEHLPLPEFTAVVRRVLTGSNIIPRWAWIKAVQETAKFYLLFYPLELNKSNIYQTIGKKIFQRYPSIGHAGKRPWSKFIKCLSQKIRHFRHQQSRQVRAYPGMENMEDEEAAATTMYLDPTINDIFSPSDAALHSASS